jgi:hypothetical protein
MKLRDSSGKEFWGKGDIKPDWIRSVLKRKTISSYLIRLHVKYVVVSARHSRYINADPNKRRSAVRLPAAQLPGQIELTRLGRPEEGAEFLGTEIDAARVRPGRVAHYHYIVIFR